MRAPYIALLFTTFPKTSEAFLQREVAALMDHGVNVRLYSLWGGGGNFRGLPVRTFSKWRLIPLFLFTIPWQCVRRPRVVRDLFEGVFSRRAPSWLNFWENMLGAGFAGSFHRELSRDPPALIHAAWAGAPATAGWLLWRMFGWPYAAGAHAYDVYEHGGDWWLREKLQHACFVSTSTEMVRRELIARGVPAERIICVRRGLEALPPCKPLRAKRRPIRLICIARLVSKKGLFHQLEIHAALRKAGVEFTSRIVGDGPLRTRLEEKVSQLGLRDWVSFEGWVPPDQIWDHLAWADVLLHTGIVTSTGDRDGLPNVIPEAMAAGVLVVTSPIAATTEAIAAGRTGLVADVENPEEWVAAIRRLAEDDSFAGSLRETARRWVEENYDARQNTARLVEAFRAAMRKEISPQ